MCRQIHIHISLNKNIKFWKHALTQHILGGDIAHFQVRAAAACTCRYVLWSCRLHFGARTTRWSCWFAGACRWGEGGQRRLELRALFSMMTPYTARSPILTTKLHYGHSSTPVNNNTKFNRSVSYTTIPFSAQFIFWPRRFRHFSFYNFRFHFLFDISNNSICPRELPQVTLRDTSEVEWWAIYRAGRKT